MDCRPIYRAHIPTSGTLPAYPSESSELVDLVTIAAAFNVLGLSLHAHSIKSKPGAPISVKTSFCDHVERVVAVEVMLTAATKMTEEGRKFFSTECHHVAL